MQHRLYQHTLKGRVYDAWSAGYRVVVMVLPTGGGKTKILGDIHEEHDGWSVKIAHRDNLVGQLSDSLASRGIPHNIIASQKVRRLIAAKHIRKYGRSFYVPTARVTVAGVDTLTRMKPDELVGWVSRVTLGTVDEAHHVVLDNKWDRAVKLFTNPTMKWLFPTATPERADGQGLGTPQLGGNGLADAMVEGPSPRELIDDGYLCDYRVVCPLSDLAALAADLPLSASGDISPKALREASHKSKIVGDFPPQYLKYAKGKTNITFVVDVETAEATVASYRSYGIRAEMITGDTDPTYRDQIIGQLEADRLDVLVAVDVVSEGTDIPAVDCISAGRPTESIPLWFQQFGRMLRPIYAPGYDLDTRAGRLAAIAAGPKPYALLIDHVGNFVKGDGAFVPDRPRVWSLASRDSKAGKPTGVPQQICTGCTVPYDRLEHGKTCPHCGYKEVVEVGARGGPERVDGDLYELDADALAQLRGAVAVANVSLEERREQLIAAHCPPQALERNVRAHATDLHARQQLLDVMDIWAGLRHAAGDDDRTIQRRFHHLFGIDVMTAQTLKAREAQELADRIRKPL